MTGFVPSLEPFSYVMPREEFGAGGAGKRIIQLGFDWMPPEKMALSELPARVQRLAYREFTKNLALEMAEFRKLAGREFFRGIRGSEADSGNANTKEIEALVDDLLFLQNCVNFQRVWSWASPLVDPKLYDRKAQNSQWREVNREEFAQRLNRLRKIAKVSKGERGIVNATVLEMAAIAEFIVRRWADRTP